MRIGPAATAIAIAGIIGGAVIVERRIPARIDVGSDTLIVNGFQPVAIGARLINRHGNAIWKAGLRVDGGTGSIARVTNTGAITCVNIGDERVTVSKGHLSKSLLVRCRPITAWGVAPGLTSIGSVGFGGPVELLLGESPKPYAMNPLGPDHRPVELLQGRASVRDTSVARLDGALISPVHVGSTIVDVEFSGGARAEIAVAVRKSMIDTALTMVAGEMHSWPVPLGRYEVKIHHDSTSRSAAPVFAATNANCASGREGPQHYYCSTTEGSRFIVSGPRTARASTGRLSVVQLRQGG
jgi:hypothetical protein